MAGECVMDPASSWGLQHHAAEAWREIDPLVSPTLWASVAAPRVPTEWKAVILSCWTLLAFMFWLG